ncbi:MAG: AtzE family amidohydrolase, partial [Gammaproteobacteria bacterium]
MSDDHTSAVQIAAAVRAGTTRARHVVEQALQRIDTLDGRLNAFTGITVERALEEADAVDRAVAG